jgi:hypothetical protein
MWISLSDNKCVRSASHDDDVRLPSHEFGNLTFPSLGLTARMTPFDNEILTFRISQVIQLLNERLMVRGLS